MVTSAGEVLAATRIQAHWSDPYVLLPCSLWELALYPRAVFDDVGEFFPRKCLGGIIAHCHSVPFGFIH